MEVRLINMIPNALSSETNQDSEPQISIHPLDLTRLVGSAFTPDPGAGPAAPIYVSLDGGATWFLNSILPGAGSFGTADITLRIAASGNLYAGIVRGDILLLDILRASQIDAATPMTLLASDAVGDQPYTEVWTANDGDRLYVGDNDVPGTAVMFRSLDASVAPPPSGFVKSFLDPRPHAGQDGPSVRTAIHKDGTVYVAYFGWRKFAKGGVVTTDVVVARDDSWGAGPNSFTALLDSLDHLPGMRVATGVTIKWNAVLDQERTGSHLAIAVDPNDSSSVWVAWADVVSGPYTIRVRHSTDGGVTWSGDVRIIANALNPGLAVSDDGQLGFLYQQVSAGRWDTHVEITRDDWVTNDDVLLATVPTGVPVRQFLPYIGDYACLTTCDNRFFGAFCTANTPLLTNFPFGVVFQRNANFATSTLLSTDNTTPVPVSIDPFFYSIDNGNMWLYASLDLMDVG